MARGGAREGAGRPAGAITRRTREVAAKASEEGITPLDYMLQVLRDVGADKADRMWAAEKAAPYIHPKLANIEHTGKNGGPIQHAHQLSDQDLADIATGRGPRTAS